ncbi:MAG: tRNA (adenosine(37)-N6)-dimethylallyltransferase MiaA [Lachnospiraceae bacterium]|nr:tRNA (adenosine(37)-N6)-dimethylallyltransferase MiaA [Lachnospiraceae bacterium]
MKKKLVIISGPTGVGKTNLSIALAKLIGGEIISADSMQVYKYMDIGSAKVTVEEMDGVTHHLIDVLSPMDSFDVNRFQSMAYKAMDEIYERGHIPIIVGGTGFYIQSVLYNIDFQNEPTDQTYRKELEQLYTEKGGKYLHEMLQKVDAKAAEEIHENNVKRVIRALEYYKQTGEKISDHNQKQKEKISPYDFTYFVLTDDRQKLYQRIDERVDEMVEQGLVDEVKKLKSMGCDSSMVSMQGIGYKEILDYLEEKYSLERAIYLIKQGSRHYAKRQLTWFRREKDVTWINKEDFSYDNHKILEYMKQKIFQ